MASKRKTYDAKLKERVVLAVKSGDMTVKQASEKYDVQPFQVLAWVGEYSLRNSSVLTTGLPASSPTPVSAAPDVHTGDTGLLKALSEEAAASSIDPSLAQAVGEWYLKNRLSKELAKTDGNSGNQD